MLKNIYQLLKYGHRIQRINLALARGALSSSLRSIDPTRPATWEFSAFSQNGEDGIIDFLTRNLTHPNRYFIEIGAADGLENNSSWLAIGRKYAGLMVEGDATKWKRGKRLLSVVNAGVTNIRMFVTRENAAELKRLAGHGEPDLLSLDIDGNDFYVAQSLLECGFRPRIFVVEYNSAFGPEASRTIKYRSDFDFNQAHPTRLYYGVSVAGWRRFFARHKYQFVTVDLNGVNAFFIDPEAFPSSFTRKLKGVPFLENRYQALRFQTSWEAQFQKIKEMEFVEIE